MLKAAVGVLNAEFFQNITNSVDTLTASTRAGIMPTSLN
jgi:hypothetical protein